MRFVIQDRRPTVWMEGGYAERLGLGEMPAIQALGQVVLTHGMNHLGQLEMARTLLGLPPVIGV